MIEKNIGLRVSVVIPTYKGSSSVSAAVESVLGQGFNACEVIVVDDNPPESDERIATHAIMREYVESSACVRYIEHKSNKGGSAARNTGLRACVGEYVCFLDDDDVYVPGRIRRSAEVLDNNPECDMVFCDALHVYDSEGNANYYRIDATELTPCGILMNEAAIGTGSNFFMRREAVIAHGGFDEAFQRHQDLEFAIGMLGKHRPIAINEPLIVKGYNGVDNVPEYEKMAKVKKQFNEKFSSLIESLAPDDRNRYLCNCHMSLFRSALLSNNAQAANEHLHEAFAHGEPQAFKKTIQLLICRFGLYRQLALLKPRAATVSNGTDVSFCRNELALYEKLAKGAQAKARSLSLNDCVRAEERGL